MRRRRGGRFSRQLKERGLSRSYLAKVSHREFPRYPLSAQRARPNAHFLSGQTECSTGSWEPPRRGEARKRLDDLREKLEEEAPAALESFVEGFYDVTAVLTLPGKYRRRLRTTNMLERFIQEIRRREKVGRIFPNIESDYRLVGALCAETHEEGSTGRRYLDMGEYFEWKAAQQEASEQEELGVRDPAESIFVGA